MAPSPQDLVCATCGVTVAATPGPDPEARAGDSRGDEALAVARLTWTRGTERGETVWTCDRCSRAHLRSIEAKLDRSWW